VRGLAFLAAALSGLALWACRGEEDPTARRSFQEATVVAEVRSRLLALAALKPLPLAVDFRGGTLRVTGDVHDSTQVQAIRAVAERVRGVERVELDLELVPAPDSTPPPPPPRPRRRAPEPPAPPESLPSLEEAG
jgi:hypothetical protein